MAYNIQNAIQWAIILMNGWINIKFRTITFKHLEFHISESEKYSYLKKKQQLF